MMIVAMTSPPRSVMPEEARALNCPIHIAINPKEIKPAAEAM